MQAHLSLMLVCGRVRNAQAQRVAGGVGGGARVDVRGGGRPPGLPRLARASMVCMGQAKK